LAEFVHSDPVVRIVECRRQDQIVGDIEISIAGRQTLAVEKRPFSVESPGSL
jgi:hypothetical protein